MENLINLISTLSQNKNTTPTHSNPIPKEVQDQYPYGEFPLRHTKLGQEVIRKSSESRFAYSEPSDKEKEENSSETDFKNLIPLIQILSQKKHSSKDMFKVLSQLLFKDKPEFQNILELFSKNNSNQRDYQEIDNRESFPNTNKVSISSLQKIK